MLHEQRNVVAPLAQRRQLHRDDVQAVEQILAERALGDHLREIGVRRGDDADVDLDRLRVADALELALLQHAQQLGLQRRAHRPDLVEEERALVRLLEPALARADRAGERAAHVTEQLRLEQRLRNRAAVDRDEAVARAAALLWWIARAASSLPVPVSPVISTVLDVAATVSSRWNRSRITRLRADDAVDAIALLELRAQVGVLGLAAGAARAPS